MKGKGCLIAAAVGFGLLALFLALVGPAVVREGGKIYRPIAQMEGAQKDFKAWSQEHAFKTPAEVSLSADQLDRFLSLHPAYHLVNSIDIPKSRELAYLTGKISIL